MENCFKYKLTKLKVEIRKPKNRVECYIILMDTAEKAMTWTLATYYKLAINPVTLLAVRLRKKKIYFC